MTNLKLLSCFGNNLSTLDLSGLTALETLDISLNSISTIDLSGLSNLKTFGSLEGALTSLDVSGLALLEGIDCGYNQLTSINLQGATSLEDIDVSGNQLTEIDFSGLVNLETVSCSSNLLTTLDFSGNNNMVGINFSDNAVTAIDISGCHELTTLLGDYNLLTALDISGCPSIYTVFVAYNQLEYINMKNGVNGEGIDFMFNPDLAYICVDEEELEVIQAFATGAPNNYNCVVNTYCSFAPGGESFTVTGNTTFDGDGDCAGGTVMPQMAVSISDGENTGMFIANTSGNYSIPVTEGSYTFTPVNPNPDYYTVSPESVTITFPDEASPYAQDFCLSPIGDFVDFELTLIPLEPARPGFDASYRILYKNKGTSQENAFVTFVYDSELLEFVSSTQPLYEDLEGGKVWEAGFMAPFEEGYIDVVMNVNSPTDDPAVNNGDVLHLSAIVEFFIPEIHEETPEDNISELNQTVVGSFDPNDKTCLEGTTIIPDMVGEYVTYLIRFENTGDYYAENIVVVDMIDTEKFEISTLTPLQSSHEYVTRITEGNKVEFIFENIMLPGMPSEDRHGYVAFKIKTKATLQVDDSFSNTAAIYFDFNHPIITNEAVTTVTILGTPDFDFNANISLYPNPTSGILNIEPKNDITLRSIEVYNILGQRVVFVANVQERASLDVPRLASGTYTIKVITDKGAAYSKFIKN